MDTCVNLTIHGPSFMVRKEVHYICRIIYCIIYIHIWFAVVYTICNYYNHYHKNPIRFTTRSDYLHWNTTYPSITLCEKSIDNMGTNSNSAENGTIKNPARYVDEIAFFEGTCFSCLSDCATEDAVCSSNFEKIVSDHRTTCENFFSFCKWNTMPELCCKIFRPVQTEFGTCYTFNNNHVTEKAQFRSTMTTLNPDVLEINAFQDYEAFLHSSDDIPFWNMEYDRRITVPVGSEAHMIFSIVEIVNEPEVSMTSPEVRRCRFSDEVPPEFLSYKFYSYSVCITECRFAAQLALCNCTHHLSPPEYKDRICDIEGLKCLTRNHDTLRSMMIPDGNVSGIECDCLPSCTEPDYNIVSNKLDEPVGQVISSIAWFTLGARPHQRITRQVTRTPLDLVVAMGNCIGLFFGGSILSIIEIVYYLCFRKWHV